MTRQVIGHYEIQGLLGSGGVGYVYAALDRELGRAVALKALRPEFASDPSFVERFRGEAANLARLNHPNITTLYSLHRGTAPDRDDMVMVMELVHGQTLKNVLACSQRLGVEACLAVIAQAVAGLSYAHRLGVIHRDIKPSNLMLNEAGLLKITDFGIARVQGSERLTRDGSMVGTLAYIAPEQIKGSEGDERSDIYSLACVLYELLTGNPPFRGDNEYELIRAQVETQPRPLAAEVPDLSADAERALMRALAKSPDERFASMAEFAQALGTASVQENATDIVRTQILAVTGLPAATRVIDQIMNGGPVDSAEFPLAPEPISLHLGGRPVAVPKRRRFATALGVAVAVLAAGGGYWTYSRVSAPATRSAQAHTAIAPQPAGPPEPPVAPPVAAGGTAEASLAPPVVAPATPGPAAPAAPPAKPAVSAPPPPVTTIKGDVASYSGEGWPVIAGQVVRLSGLQSLSTGETKQISEWVAGHGNYLECTQVAAGEYRCLTRQSLDLAQAILLNGAARANADAAQTYREAEQKAREAKRGVWQ